MKQYTARVLAWVIRVSAIAGILFSVLTVLLPDAYAFLREVFIPFLIALLVMMTASSAIAVILFAVSETSSSPAERSRRWQLFFVLGPWAAANYLEKWARQQSAPPPEDQGRSSQDS